MAEARARRGRRGRNGAGADTSEAANRNVNYRQLKNPFQPVSTISDDEVQAIHNTALRVLEELGIKVLLPEAREIFKATGARVNETDEMVFIGRDIVEAAIASAPRSFKLRGANRNSDVVMELGSLSFQPGGGVPNITDLERGRRPGSLESYREMIRLTQHFDIFHLVGPSVEPQDSPVHLRHYDTMQMQLLECEKIPFAFSRGTPQVMDCFEMVQQFRGVSDAEFRAAPHCYTIINSNSPRMLDIPMAQGLIDFARNWQMSILTPFTLMGAMAPITVAGALTLSHAEALAGLTLTQLVQPGSPVMYGTFTSNVDMKSGSPAFGTPEHFRASTVAGQLARLLGLPWRCAGGSAANINDAQAANESQLGVWGCVLGGATTVVHSAGWLEGGLTVSLEKIITDAEVLQMVADLCQCTKAGLDEIGFDALTEVQPGGHFFSAGQTMARYKTEFYQPLVADWSNFGNWSEAGSIDANNRATGIWKRIVSNAPNLSHTPDSIGALQDFIAHRTSEGGAPPES